MSQVLEAVTPIWCTEHLFSVWLTQLTQELLKDKFSIIILNLLKLINIITQIAEKQYFIFRLIKNKWNIILDC